MRNMRTSRRIQTGMSCFVEPGTASFVHKLPGMSAEVFALEASPWALMETIGCSAMDAVEMKGGVVAYVDGDGPDKGLPVNFVLNESPLVGPVIFSRRGMDGELLGFSEDEALLFCQKLNRALG